MSASAQARYRERHREEIAARAALRWARRRASLGVTERVRPVDGIVAAEPELGTQRRCLKCGDPWPLDREFFTPQGLNRRGQTVYRGECRACEYEVQARRRRTVAT